MPLANYGRPAGEIVRMDVKAWPPTGGNGREFK
jgi:hypothetical protein